MTTNADGTYSCDSCGWGVGGGGVATCAVVSDLDPDARGAVRSLRFCRDHQDDDGDTVRGCVHKLLRPSMLKHYTSTKENSTDE